MNIRLALIAAVAMVTVLGTACNKPDNYKLTPPSVIQLSPANGSTAQPDTITLSCNPYTNAMHYYFFVTNVSTLQMTQYDTDTPALTVPLAPAQRYNWQVSVLTTDSISASSTTWSFTTR
ncbi:MAG: hypothetical protein JST90_07985 [Bacteroidetes bacterium]|nr:hypothetical protein [Bacteroidota bacterium]